MDEHPGDAMSWYASGCYYMACGQVYAVATITRNLARGLSAAASSRFDSACAMCVHLGCLFCFSSEPTPPSTVGFLSEGLSSHATICASSDAKEASHNQVVP